MQKKAIRLKKENKKACSCYLQALTPNEIEYFSIYW